VAALNPSACTAANPEWVKAALPVLGASFGPVSTVLEKQYRDTQYRHGHATYAESISARRKEVGKHLLDKTNDQSLTCLYQKASGTDKGRLKQRMDAASAEYVFLLQLEKEEANRQVATTSAAAPIVPADRGTRNEQARQTQAAVLQQTAKAIVAHTQKAAVQAALDAHTRPTVANQKKALHLDTVARGAKRMAQPQLAQPQLAQPQLAQPQLAQPQLAQPQLAQPQLAQPQLATIVRDLKTFVNRSLAAGPYTITIKL